LKRKSRKKKSVRGGVGSARRMPYPSILRSRQSVSTKDLDKLVNMQWKAIKTDKKHIDNYRKEMNRRYDDINHLEHVINTDARKQINNSYDGQERRKENARIRSMKSKICKPLREYKEAQPRDMNYRESYPGYFAQVDEALAEYLNEK